MASGHMSLADPKPPRRRLFPQDPGSARWEIVQAGNKRKREEECPHEPTVRTTPRSM